jgi:hypothetical protein
VAILLLAEVEEAFVLVELITVYLKQKPLSSFEHFWSSSRRR